MDTGSTVNVITQRIVDELNVPLDPLAAITLSDWLGRSVETLGRVKLVFRLADDEKRHESWFHVLPDNHVTTGHDAVLGLEFIRRTQAFVLARREAQLRPE
jgi:hypothetical protein